MFSDPVLCLFKANSYESKAAFSSIRNKKVKIYITNFAFKKKKQKTQMSCWRAPGNETHGTKSTHSQLYSACETLAEAPEGPYRVVDARWRYAPELRGPDSRL